MGLVFFVLAFVVLGYQQNDHSTDDLVGVLLFAGVGFEFLCMIYSPIVYFSQPSRRRESAWAAALSWGWFLFVATALLLFQS